MSTKESPETEIMWRSMHAREHAQAVSDLIDQASDESWKPHVLGEEMMKLFYDQIPYVGNRTFWMDILDHSLERVDWTKLAKRALGKEK